MRCIVVIIICDARWLWTETKYRILDTTCLYISLSRPPYSWKCKLFPAFLPLSTRVVGTTLYLLLQTHITHNASACSMFPMWPTKWLIILCMSHLLFVVRSCSTAPFSYFCRNPITIALSGWSFACLCECNKSRIAEWFFITYCPGDFYTILHRLSYFLFQSEVLTSFRDNYEGERNWKTGKPPHCRATWFSLLMKHCTGDQFTPRLGWKTWRRATAWKTLAKMEQ